VVFIQSGGVGVYTRQAYSTSNVCAGISTNTVYTQGCYYEANYDIGPYREYNTPKKLQNFNQKKKKK
jgi:hypothetical protein